MVDDLAVKGGADSNVQMVLAARLRAGDPPDVRQTVLRASLRAYAQRGRTADVGRAGMEGAVLVRRRFHRVQFLGVIRRYDAGDAALGHGDAHGAVHGTAALLRHAGLPHEGARHFLNNVRGSTSCWKWPPNAARARWPKMASTGWQSSRAS